MIAKKSTLIVLQNLVGLLFGFITIKIVAVNMGKEVYGEMVTGLAIVSLFSYIAVIGYGNSHMKRISEGKDLGTCIGTFIVVRVLTTALFIGSFLGALVAYTYLYPGALTDVSLGVILAILVYYLFIFLGSIPLVTFDARAETSKSQLANMAQHPFKLAAVVYVVMTAAVLAKSGQPHEAAYRLTWAFYTVGAIVTCMVAWSFFFYYKYPVKKPTWPMFKSYSSFAALTSISGLLGIIIMNADRIMLNHYWGIDAVGQYFGVQTFSNNLQMIPAALTTILMPVISHLDLKKDVKSICRLLAQSERQISLIIAPITFFMFFFSRPIIKLLLADDWLAADFTLSFLAIVTFITALNSIRNTLLLSVGRPDLTASISTVIVALNIAVNFLFIPDWPWFHPTLTIPSYITPSGQTHVIALTSHTGAAVALVIANLIGFFLLRYYTWKCIKASIYHGVTVKHVFASIIMTLPLIYLNRVHELARWYDLIIYMLIGLGIYLAVLYLIKEFRKEDLDFYLGLMNPKGMGNYISAELKEKDLGVALETIDGDEKGAGKKGKSAKKAGAPRRRGPEEE